MESPRVLAAFPGMHTPERPAVTDPLIKNDPGILGGTPVFSGTRVPVRILMEYLEAGDRLDEFLDHFPSVPRKQAVQVLEHATALLVGHAQTARRIPFPSVQGAHGPGYGMDRKSRRPPDAA